MRRLPQRKPQRLWPDTPCLNELWCGLGLSGIMTNVLHIFAKVDCRIFENRQYSKIVSGINEQGPARFASRFSSGVDHPTGAETIVWRKKMNRKRAIDKTIGLRLAQIRRQRGLSQHELARTIGATVGLVKHYEHGRAAIASVRLAQLARALGCQIADLLAPLGAPMPRHRLGGSIGACRVVYLHSDFDALLTRIIRQSDEEVV